MVGKTSDNLQFLEGLSLIFARFILLFSCAYMLRKCPFITGQWIGIQRCRSESGVIFKLSFRRAYNCSARTRLHRACLQSWRLNKCREVTIKSVFQQHIQLKPVNDHSKHAFLSPSLHSLIVTEAFNEHVGNYNRVKVQFSLDIGRLQRGLFPLALRYDAIMHEIRSHRVAVFFKSARSGKTKLTDFVYSETNGNPTVHVLSPVGWAKALSR